MAKRLQHRGGTTSQHSTFTGAVREVTVDTDKNTLVVHDGATAGGHPLATATNFTSTGIDDNATSTAITIDSSERVGIGISSPSGNLHVNNASGSGELTVEGALAYTGALYLQAARNAGSGSTCGLIQFRNTNNSNEVLASLNAQANRSLTVFTNGSERMRIDSSGNLLLNTTSQVSSAILSLNGSIGLDRTSTYNQQWLQYISHSGTSDYGTLNFSPVSGQTTAGFKITDAAGNNRFQIRGSGDSTKETVFNQSGADFDFRVESNNNANMLFVDGGNDRIGIGTSSPLAPLEVNSGNSDTNSIFKSTDNNCLIIISDDDSSSTIAVESDGSGGVLKFNTGGNGSYANNSEAMRINSSGNVLINTTTAPSNHTNSLVIGNDITNPNVGGIFGHQMINKCFQTSANDVTNFDITLTASSHLIGCFTVSVFGGYGTSNREGYAEYRVYCNRETSSIRTITVQSPVNENGSFTSGYTFSATKPSTSTIKFAITKPTGANYQMIISGELVNHRFTGATRSES
jgi:hypothetical protein